MVVVLSHLANNDAETRSGTETKESSNDHLPPILNQLIKTLKRNNTKYTTRLYVAAYSYP